MAVRCLRSKLSERIFTHALKDARIMPHRGLPPLASEATKISPLARHYSAMGSSMPIKNLTFQSKVPERMPFGFLPNAKNALRNEAGYNLSSSFKGKYDPILIHGRRNFSSCPPGTKNIRKMHSRNKGSNGTGTERIFVVKGPIRSWSRSELITKIIKGYAVVFCSVNGVAFYYYYWDSLCSNPYLFFVTVSGHIFCLLFILHGVLG